MCVIFKNSVGTYLHSAFRFQAVFSPAWTLSAWVLGEGRWKGQPHEICLIHQIYTVVYGRGGWWVHISLNAAKDRPVYVFCQIKCCLLWGEWKRSNNSRGSFSLKIASTWTGPPPTPAWFIYLCSRVLKIYVFCFQRLSLVYYFINYYTYFSFS
jgi:hypothetical protein